MFCLFGYAPNDSFDAIVSTVLSETEKEVVQMLYLVKSRFNYFLSFHFTSF